jgi:hypothetical protein
MCANISVFIYFMISYGKDITILYHYLTFSVNTRAQSPSVGLGLGIEGFVPFGEVAEAGSQWNKRRERRREISQAPRMSGGVKKKIKILADIRFFVEICNLGKHNKISYDT